jgi:hypothetical protein
MDVRAALKSQYHASLEALRLAIEQCPSNLWDDPADGAASYWRVAYHTLFFTDYYLRKDHQHLPAWSRHRYEAHVLGPISWDGGRLPELCEPYTTEDILEYWTVCDALVDATVDAMDLESVESGFPWYAMSKFEHQLVNIRHIQHHAAALATRLRRDAGIQVRWVGKLE